MLPLSEILRPKKLTEIVGQESLLHFISKVIQTEKPTSFILFGPPGSGKTTIARIYAQSFNIPFVHLSGVFNTTTDLKKILKEGQDNPLFHRQTLLFVDEIHRFNRAQQDIFLPFLEDGSLILVGSTTENPSFALNNALLSRVRVLKLEPLAPENLREILNRTLSSRPEISITDEQKETLISHAQGDARHLINMIESLQVGLPIQKRPALYDKHQEGHFNLISALHKSIRGSDPDAALYWFARMISGGEDPLFIARRLIRMASEDIGLADPEALTQALNSYNVYKRLGSPEGELALAQAVIYLSLAPKSNATYLAYNEALALAGNTGHIDPPNHILNAPTKLMKELGMGKGYLYDHDAPNGFSGQQYLPESLGHHTFYRPVERGFEREMKKRIEYFTKLKTKIN